MTAPAAAVCTNAKPATNSTAPVDSNYKKIIQVIVEIAVQMLVPLGAAFLMYFTLPLSISLIAAPIAAVASAIAISFFIPKKVEPQPVLPLTATAPSGLRNGGNDCWANSLAQMLRIDAGIKKWFTEAPDGLETHAMYFEYFSQELLENLLAPGPLPEEVYGNLAVGDPLRAWIDDYINWLRNRPEEERENILCYLRFIRQSAMPNEVAKSLSDFKDFMEAYDQAAPGQIVAIPNDPMAAGNQVAGAARPYYTRSLRIAINRVFQDITTDASQQDPATAISGMDKLLPDHLKVQTQVTKRYDIRGKEPFRPQDAQAGARTNDDGNEIIQIEPGVAIPKIEAPMNGSFPNIQNFLERRSNAPNRHPGEGSVKRLSYGVEAEYPLLWEKFEYVTAPATLWVQIKRFRHIEPQFPGLHRMMPDWFRAKPADQVKNEGEVEIQDVIELQPVNGPLARYRLDGFIVHLGVDNGGHYISYRLGEDGVWYKCDDSQVIRMSDAQMQEARKKAYIPHYSKIEE
jgi:hypothetical protein